MNFQPFTPGCPVRACFPACRGVCGGPCPLGKHLAFTRWELAIVATVLMVLAAFVVPQFSEATQDSRLSGLISELQNVRTQIGLYRMQHRGKNPTLRDFARQMTMSSNFDGLCVEQPSSAFPFGPYLTEMPENPYTRSREVSDGPAGPDQGWYYNEVTGEFRTNDGVHDYL